MSATKLLKPLRTSYLTMLGGVASTLGLGQAMFLKATYQSPPDARGPRSGLETSTSTSSPASSSPVIHSDLANATSSGGGEQQEGQKQILIIGDSLVSGVGGVSSFEDGPSDGPALPRQVARSLSQLMNANVAWKSMSLTGGDVRMLRRKIIPMMRRERTRGTLGNIQAIVLVTGVNDWKRFSPSRTADIFKHDLKLLIDDIHSEVGKECLVILPAIPGVRHTPRFHEPLRSIVVFLNELWDGQKLLLARSMKNVFFVGQPANREWGEDPLIYFSELDRVHPSELGYTVWAERIAAVMKEAFTKVRSNISANVEKISSSVAQQLKSSANVNVHANVLNSSQAQQDAFNQMD